MTSLNRYVGPVLFPSILWHTAEQSVHITFDDGPHPVATPKVLEILRKRRVAATFFLLGTSVRQFPEIARQVSLEGHSVGNHSMNHTTMFLKPMEHQRDQIQRGNEIIENTLQLRPRAFRPPFGHFDCATLKIAKAEGQRVVLWDVNPRDFSAAQANSVVHAATRRAKSGSIILFHDNDSTASTLVRFLNPILDQLEQRGFKFSHLPV